MNPAIIIAKGTPTEACEEDNVRCSALCVQHGGPHSGFVRCLQDQRRERLPVGRWHGAVRHRESGAKCLGDQWPMLPRGIGDFHVAVYSYAQLAAQDIELLRSQRAEMFRNGVEPVTSA